VSGKVKLFVVMVMLAVLLLSACSDIPDSQVDIDTVRARLQQIDDYKQSVPDTKEIQKAYNTSDATFRGIKFGLSMEMVSAIETLPLSEQFSDALDYTGGAIYGYDMLITYWFNLDNQLYRAAYSMTNGQYFDTVESLTAALKKDYSEPYVAGYFDYENAGVAFDTSEEALQAVDSKNAYYYEAFVDDFGTQIELFVEKTEDRYGYWVCYTDYSYYNG